MYDGRVAPGFEPVTREFVRNFEDRGDVGAAFAAYVQGELVVDLWGGLADRAASKAWQSDTLQILFSGSKGLVATCMLLLIERGRVELDAPIARYWPEFASAGKDRVALRDVLGHKARLPALETPVTWREATDHSRMAGLLAAQPQNQDPRAAATYHAMTFGWLCGEIVRRVDGRTLGRFFADEVAAPLGLDIWIGLPTELEARVARVELAPTWGASSASRQRLAGDPLPRGVHANPRRYDRDHLPWNEQAWHAAEVPSVNAIGTARAVARLYASLDRLLSPATLDLGRQPLSTYRDTLTGQPRSWGVGFQLQTDRLRLGPPRSAFGHTGAGGSAHGSWPEQKVGFSYAMNLLRDDEEGESRAGALLTALHDCMTARRDRPPQ